MRRHSQGFTLIELMISTAIMAFVLVTLVVLFNLSTKALETNEAASERQQNAEAAAELLRYEVGLAGYRGTSSTALTSNTFTGSTVSVGVNTSASASDTITVQYYEDRFYDGSSTTTLLSVTFSTGTDANGNPVLLRQQGSSGALAAAADVALLKVVKYVDRDGSIIDVTTSSTIPEALAAISVELTFADGESGRFLVGFENTNVVEQTTISSSFFTPTITIDVTPSVTGLQGV
jgi:prepilin-type N-terminal cleavage/methylation domain-containing protein